jgi:drug/metabolite transporter (DMT)-like permease
VIPARARVHVALFVTMMVWGLNLTVVKLLTQVLDVALLTLLRMALAAAVLWLLLRWRHAARHPWSGGEWLVGLILAGLMVYAQQLLFSEGMARSSATNAALVVALGPFVSLLAEGLVFGKRLPPRQLIGVTLALCGVATVILSQPQAQWSRASLGDLLIFASVVTFAAGGVMMQKMVRRRSMLSISTFTHAAGAAMLLAHASVVTPGGLAALLTVPWWGWGLIAFSGIFATALGAMAWTHGIQALGVGRTASYLSWVPVFGVGFGALLLNEPLTLWHVVGGAGVLAGSTLALRTTGRSAGEKKS